MHEYTLSQVSDAVLLRDLAALAVKDRLTTASILAHIAEVDARRLYAPAGYPSMHAFCVEELRLSEDSAYKRIQAARAARRFPALFVAIAEGRLHLAAVCLLAPHLTAENAEELIQAATHRPKSEIEAMLARRFPVPGMPGPAPVVRAIPCPPIPCPPTSCPPISQLAPGQVAGTPAPLAAPAPLGAASPPAAPSPERYLLQLTIGKTTHEKLRYAQALLSHAVPSGDVAEVLDRALDALISRLERRRFGAGARARANRKGPGSRPRAAMVGKRCIPAQVRRAVWERDEGQCTFVSGDGRRCKARRFLEFDHVVPVARGGTGTVEGLRLRCRAHNQHEADRAFGAEFMRRKRRGARPAATEARERTVSARERTVSARERAAPARERAAPARTLAETQEEHEDLLAGLRSLGCRGELARRAADFSRTIRYATLEDRLRAALQFVGRRSVQAARPRAGPTRVPYSG
jgi:hypothetical protein